MKILIIGCKGFIGSHTYDHFARTGNDVYGCDVLVEYNDSHYFQVDATNADYNELFLSNHFDVCINCSGAASVPDSFAHPWRDFHLNVQTVYSVLEAIRKHSPSCKFISISSAAVYGNPEVLPVSESSKVKPLSPYGWHKHYTEMICGEFYTYFKIPTCSVRIFSAYGPGLRKQLFWDWFQKINESKHITLYGTGKESRDFIFIDDIVRALDCVIANSSFKGDVINVANQKEIGIEKAIEIFKNESGIPFTYRFNNEVRPGDPLNWKADISKLSAMGYRQEISFEEGIKRYLQWLREKK